MDKSDFESYLTEGSATGSGKVSSYLRALQLLGDMLEIEPYEFGDCVDVWSVESVDRLIKLRELVLDEQKKEQSPWHVDDIPVSYLRDGYCSAALTQLIQFLPHQRHVDHLTEIYESHEGGDGELAAILNVDPTQTDGYAHDPNTKDGQDRIREAKTRIGQHAFRKMIMSNYESRCCITGLNIPTLNRASHIIGWAERKETRMLPSNGLCLSATYDAAFDKKLISFDEDYRLIVSKEIRDHYTVRSAQEYFEQREGDILTMPKRDAPKQEYLAEHRKAGGF